MTPPRDWLALRTDHRGRFDELVARNVDVVHMEMMDDGCLWARLEKGERALVLRIYAKKRGLLEVTTEDDTPAPLD